MKKLVLTGARVCAVVGALAVLAGCASNSGVKTSAPAAAKHIERVIVDYKGATIGSEVPAWVEAAIDGDSTRLSRDKRFEGRTVVIDYGTGQNLDLLRSWVNNFNVQASVSRRISNMVSAQFGGEQLGSKDTPEARNFLKEVVATFSQTRINGLSQDMDYWIKMRTIDNDKKTSTEQYYYYVVFSIDEKDLSDQINRAMGKIAAKTKEEQELKSDVEDAMKKVAFAAVQESNI